MIEEDAGRQLAMNVARMLVVYLKRAGGQSQYSALLAAQAQSESETFDSLDRWIAEHLNDDLRVGALAEQVHISPRNFARAAAVLFHQDFGNTAARVSQALWRHRLISPSVVAGATASGVTKSIGARASGKLCRPLMASLELGGMLAFPRGAKPVVPTQGPDRGSTFSRTLRRDTDKSRQARAIVVVSTLGQFQTSSRLQSTSTFRGQSGHQPQAYRCPLMTQSGHCASMQSRFVMSSRRTGNRAKRYFLRWASMLHGPGPAAEI
jgi:hypothetical protein